MKTYVGIAAIALLSSQSAQAWYGPICYSATTRELVLTVPSVAGETAGDVRVDFDDLEGEIERFETRASKTVKNAHEVVLLRGAESTVGVVGVVITSPRSTTGYKFEIDFQKDPSLCSGAIVRAADRPAAKLATSTTPRRAPVAKAKPEISRVEPAQDETAPVPAVAQANAVPTEVQEPVSIQPVSAPAQAETPPAELSTTTE
ncbi:MAG TPA: hypothetical protein VM598_06210 [Bdellovibrionota bacterium]|nr:hypothetical protein [Bdellovibrionota bacterium]